MKRDEAYAIEVLWLEFEGEKQFLLLSDLLECGIISEEEFEEGWHTDYSDVYYMTLACFFLLYLKEEF